jgi:formylglycine-generating enzyme required for sulfatase activity
MSYLRRLLNLVVLLCLAGTASAQTQPKESRVALVIGNGTYKTSPLKNPVNDAKDMATKLRGLGFVVIERSNLGIRQIGSTLREFRSKLAPGGVALVFYAGHGLQIKGENYLPAVDADIASEEDVPNQSLAIRQIMDVLSDAKTRLNLVFLDACRNNPYSRSFRSAGEGLSRVTAPSGTLISFATRPGSVAADGDGRNGVYTGALLQQMGNTSQPIEQVLKRVVTSVKATSRNRQEPWMEGSIEGEFCFGECSGPGSVSTAVSDDRALWESVKDSRDANELKVYLAQFPKGVFAALASTRVQALERGTSPAAAAAVFQSVKPGQVFKDCDVCPEMVVIPEGNFTMGSSDSSDEEPPHTVKIKSFLLGRTEVTQGQWKAVMGTNPSGFSACGDDCPVEKVSWNNARSYAQKLSQQTGKNYHLPSEAQWEYAARGGSYTKWSFGDNESELRNNAWFYSNSNNTSHRVSQMLGNAFGLYDMHGNVWEWVEDVWHPNYNAAPTDGSAWTTGGEPARRVQRGGAWNVMHGILRSANRFKAAPDYVNDYTGFRIARSP